MTTVKSWWSHQSMQAENGIQNEKHFFLLLLTFLVIFTQCAPLRDSYVTWVAPSCKGALVTQSLNYFLPEWLWPELALSFIRTSEQVCAYSVEYLTRSLCFTFNINMNTYMRLVWHFKDITSNICSISDQRKGRWQIFLTAYCIFTSPCIFSLFSLPCVLLSSSISLSLPSTAQITVKHTYKVRHQWSWLKPTYWSPRCLFAFVWDHCLLVLQGFWCQHRFGWFISKSPENMLQTHLRWCNIFLHTEKHNHVHRYACTWTTHPHSEPSKAHIAALTATKDLFKWTYCKKLLFYWRGQKYWQMKTCNLCGAMRRL